MTLALAEYLARWSGLTGAEGCRVGLSLEGVLAPMKPDDAAALCEDGNHLSPAAIKNIAHNISRNRFELNSNPKMSDLLLNSVENGGLPIIDTSFEQFFTSIPSECFPPFNCPEQFKAINAMTNLKKRERELEETVRQMRYEKRRRGSQHFRGKNAKRGRH
jgi:hypothetical protein